MTFPVRLCASCRYRSTDVPIASDRNAGQWLCGDCPEAVLDPTERLRAVCLAIGGRGECADHFGISVSWLNQVLHSHRVPTYGRIARALAEAEAHPR